MLYIDIFVCYFVALFDDNTVFIDLDQSLKPIRAEWLKKNAKNMKKKQPVELNQKIQTNKKF